MKNKKILLVILFFSLFLIVLFMNNVFSKKTHDDLDVKVTSESYTVLEDSTEIEVAIKNVSGKTISNIKLVAHLWEEDKKVSTISKKLSKSLKKGESVKLLLKTKQKYYNVTNILYDVIY